VADALARPRLSIVIVTFNSRTHIEGCLQSLVEHPPAVAHEIVVVDSASTDGTVSDIRRRWTTVRVIETGANLGFAHANSRGLRETVGELVLLLNPDTVAPAGSIDRLVSALDAAPGAAIAGPRLVDGTGRVELSFGAMPSPIAELRQKVLVRGNERGVRPLVAYVRRMARRSRVVDWVSGACLLVRRLDAEAVGLMDERFFLYLEDVDLCASVRARGRRVLFAASAEVQHLRGQSRATAPRETETAYRRSQIAFYEKHLPRWSTLLRLYLKLRARYPDTHVTQ